MSSVTARVSWRNLKTTGCSFQVCLNKMAVVNERCHRSLKFKFGNEKTNMVLKLVGYNDQSDTVKVVI